MNTKTKKIKIAFFGDDFSRQGKGTAIVVQKIAEELVKNFSGYVEIVALRRDKPCVVDVCENIKHILIPHYRLPFFSTIVSYALFFIMCKEHFDMVVFNRRIYPGFWFLRANCFVLISHNAPVSEAYKERLTIANRFFDLFIRYIGKHFIDTFVAVSEDAKQGIATYYKVATRKVYTIYNGVSDDFKVLSAQDKIQGAVKLKTKYNISVPYILNISKLDPHRNVAAVVEAFAISNITHDLVLIGTPHTPTYAEYVVRRIKELNLFNRVRMVNFIESGDMTEVYGLADLLVYPSLMEGFGMPIIEAMKCGVPVVTSNISCMPEIAGDAAILVDPQNSIAIANAIEHVLSDKILRQSLIEKGLKRAQNFSWHSSADKFLKIYEDCLYN